MKKFIYLICAAATVLLSAGCQKPDGTTEKTLTIEDFSGQWGEYYENQLVSVMDISYTEPGTILIASTFEMARLSGTKSDNSQINIDYVVSEYEIDQETGMLKFKTGSETDVTFSIVLWDGKLYRKPDYYSIATEFTRLDEPVELVYNVR